MTGHILQIELDNLPVGGLRAVWAAVRPRAFLSLVTLRGEGEEYKLRFDFQRQCFIDHIPGSEEEFPEDEMRSLGAALQGEIAKHAAEYNALPPPVTIVPVI